MKKLFIVLVIASLALVSCTKHVHKVGAGSKGMGMDEARQWYVLWGLVALNDVDTSKMTAGATDYEITTEQSGLDVVMNIFTGMVTVYSRTVTVKK